jgi:imidazolonepropionase-like amidohydrolase
MKSPGILLLRDGLRVRCQREPGAARRLRRRVDTGVDAARMSACATEELLQQFDAFHRQDIFYHLDAMVE